MTFEIFEVTILGLITVILVGAGIWAFYAWPKIWTYPFILPGIVTNIIYSRRYPGKKRAG